MPGLWGLDRHTVVGLDLPWVYQFTLAALDTLTKLYDDDPLSEFRFAIKLPVGDLLNLLTDISDE